MTELELSGGWVHPTGGNPKSVTIAALGPSREDYYSSYLSPEPPPEIQTDEVWSVNRGGLFVRHDLLFVMDHIQGEAEKYPEYGKRLWDHDKPIITSDTAEEWPMHVYHYPWFSVERFIVDEVKSCHSDWFHNSIPFLLCYAAFIGVKEVYAWGCDYHHHLSGRVEDGHPNAAYWVGALERVGMVVKTPMSSTFLGANQREYIYGYRDDPRRDAMGKKKMFNELIGKK